MSVNRIDEYIHRIIEQRLVQQRIDSYREGKRRVPEPPIQEKSGTRRKALQIFGLFILSGASGIVGAGVTSAVLNRHVEPIRNDLNAKLIENDTLRLGAVDRSREITSLQKKIMRLLQNKNAFGENLISLRHIQVLLLPIR